MPDHGTVRLLLRLLMRANTWLLVVAGGLIVALGVLGAILHATDELSTSVWAIAGTAAGWVLFAAGVLLVVALLPMVVAHGITRATVTRAAGLFMVVAAAAGAIYMAGGFLAERALFAAVDTPVTLSEPGLFESTDQVHLVLVEYLLAFTGYFLSGWLVGLGYYGYGALRGTLLLPLAMLPVIAATQGLRFAGAAWPDIPLGSARPALGIALAVITIAAAIVAAHRATSVLPLRAKT